MLIEQQLACDKGKAAKGPKWSSSQAATKQFCELLKIISFPNKGARLSGNRKQKKCFFFSLDQTTSSDYCYD